MLINDADTYSQGNKQSHVEVSVQKKEIKINRHSGNRPDW